MTFQCNKKKASSENFMRILRSVTRDLARALIPYSRGCWSDVHNPRPFIPVPLAACGKAHLECRLRHISGALFCVFGLLRVIRGVNLDLT